MLYVSVRRMCCALVSVACLQILISASSAVERYFRSGTGRPFPEITHGISPVFSEKHPDRTGVVVVEIWMTVGRLN